MPAIKIQSISSVSSEDPNHPADNLLNPETYRKWKCATAGEKKVVVVLQLDKSVQIQSVDVGNEGSAFVEVLLGRSSAPDLFEVLLGMSTFMTPVESKQWSNINRVRMFGKDKFAKSIYDQKWDRVKIVCTQPYNKAEKYGLSFINLHSPPDSSGGEVASTTTQPASRLGGFSLKEEPKDLPSGSFFHKKDRPTISTSSPISVAAQARMASSEALKNVQSDSISKKSRKSPSKTTHSGPVKRPSESASSVTNPPKKAKEADASELLTGIPFDQIMLGVVFTLSGFNNPLRGQLRGKAIDMGATFMPDWTSSCTHLVCAFPNTPKFNQVKAKHGLIVTKEWITDSRIKKQRLPAKKYRLSGDDDSSEGELYDKKEKEIFAKKTGKDSLRNKPSAYSKTDVGVVNREVGVVTSKDSVDMYEGSTDEYSGSEVKSKPHPPASDSSSECDTEDEIERAQSKMLGQSKPQAVADDPYSGSTDEEDDNTKTTTSSKLSEIPEILSLTNLPNLFSDCTFLLYGTLLPSDRRLLVRYITAYKGHIEDYMSDKVSHVVTMDRWNEHFDQALAENSRLAFVQPQWIFACHHKQTLIPYQPFVVTPTN